MNNYNILAKYITDRYIDTLTGNDIMDKLVGEDPAGRVMAGMLSENRIEETFSGEKIENAATKFESIPAISLSFKLARQSIGKLFIKISGLLFYNVKPTREEVVNYFINKYSKKDKKEYKSIEELVRLYSLDTLKIPAVYKKIDIEEAIGEGIEIELKSREGETIHLEEAITKKLNKLSDKIFEEICIIPDNKLTFYDLLNDEKFNKVICAKEVTIFPRWTFDVTCKLIKKEDSIYGFVQLINKTPISKGSVNLGYSPKLFNAGLSVKGENTVIFEEIELDYLKSTYKTRDAIYVIGENTSAEFDKTENKVSTRNVPVYSQYRVRTKDKFNEYITFDKLIKEPVKSLSYIYGKLEEDYKRTENEYNMQKSLLSDNARRMLKEDLDKYLIEVKRFKHGIDQIIYKDFVARAFKYMNETFACSLDGKKNRIKGWRLFQIVFIVSLIPDVIRSEYKDDEGLKGSDLENADLLYFPTGARVIIVTGCINVLISRVSETFIKNKSCIT